MLMGLLDSLIRDVQTLGEKEKKKVPWIFYDLMEKKTNCHIFF